MTPAERFQLVPGESGALGLVDALRPKQKPIVVDFLSPQMRFRVKNGVDSELVVKSFGVKASERKGITLIDGTCGLGTDAFLLAMAGFHVIALERNRIVFDLVSDGLRRLKKSRELEGLTPLNLEVMNRDSSGFIDDILSGHVMTPAGIYLDPMFEDTSVREKSAPKKEMAALRELLTIESADFDPTLLSRAVEAAKNRVVVKRPTGAPPMGVEHKEPRPQHRLEGKVASYDIYSCRSLKQTQR